MALRPALLRLLLVAFVGGAGPLGISSAYAEPWLASRFAQNCASCHAPGRKNVEIKDRRCTNTCQGCHVNPSGGGLRNHYGKWNEDRWLKSLASETLNSKKIPAPYKKQKYAEADLKKVNPKVVVSTGYAGLYSYEDQVSEGLYGREDTNDQIAATYEEFMLQVPKEDPYREILNTKIDGGGDVRWQMSQSTTTSDASGAEKSTDQWRNFLMVTDLALRWRPAHKYVNFVYEGRYAGVPGKRWNPDDYLATMQRRSAYVLVNDLPFNSYVQHGYYRPLFGNGSPDHTLLAQRMLAVALNDQPYMYGTTYQTTSVGAASGIPFINLHLLGHQVGPATDKKHSGFAANIGARLPSLGMMVSYSYWSANTEKLAITGTENVKPKLEMHNVTFNTQLKRVTVLIEAMSVTRDIPKTDFRQGAMGTLDTYTRLWREIYLNLQYSQANQYEDWTPGSSAQYRFGFRGFLTAGVDVSLGLNMESHRKYDGTSGVTTENKSVSSLISQVHLFM